jgi:propionyl-CoA synthetase
VAECAVIGVADDAEGAVAAGVPVPEQGVEPPHAEVVRECVALVRDRIGPVADFKRAVVVDRLPKTRSGKILRGTMVKIADGTDWKMPATIDDPAILDEITQALQSLGLAGGTAPRMTRTRPCPWAWRNRCLTTWRPCGR